MNMASTGRPGGSSPIGARSPHRTTWRGRSPTLRRHEGDRMVRTDHCGARRTVAPEAVERGTGLDRDSGAPTDSRSATAVKRLDQVCEQIAGLSAHERIELARWLVDNLPEC